MRSVLLVDDHPVVGVGITLALLKSDRFTLACIVADPADCMSAIGTHRPDALIVDLVFAGQIQMRLVEQCRAALPQAAIIVFSSLPDRIYARKALQAGADAYVSKATDLAVLLDRLAQVAAGPVAGRPPPASSRPDRAPVTEKRERFGPIHLTPREIEVARSLGRGASIAAIARTIGISANTIAVHRDNIRKKLGCRDTNDLVAQLARMDIPDDASL